MNLQSLRQERTLTKKAGPGRKGALIGVPIGWPATVLLVMAVFLLLRVYRQQGTAPSASAEYPGEVLTANTLRFPVGGRGRFALRLTRLHMEAALKGALAL